MFVNTINLTQWTANQCYSSRTRYINFKTFQIHFLTASLIFTAVKLFDQVIREQTKDGALTTSHPQWQLF